MITYNNGESIEDIVNGMLGANIWTTSIIDPNGSEICISFESIVPEDDSSALFEWDLCTHVCFWRIDSTTNILVGSHDTTQKIEDSLGHLEEGHLLSVTIDRPSLAAHFVLDNGYTIHIYPYCALRKLIWRIDLNDKRSLLANSDSTWKIVDLKN